MNAAWIHINSQGLKFSRHLKINGRVKRKFSRFPARLSFKVRKTQAYEQPIMPYQTLSAYPEFSRKRIFSRHWVTQQTYYADYLRWNPWPLRAHRTPHSTTCHLPALSKASSPHWHGPRRLPGLHSPYVTRSMRKYREYPRKQCVGHLAILTLHDSALSQLFRPSHCTCTAQHRLNLPVSMDSTGTPRQPMVLYQSPVLWWNRYARRHHLNGLIPIEGRCHLLYPMIGQRLPSGSARDNTSISHQVRLLMPKGLSPYLATMSSEMSSPVHGQN